MTGYFVTGTDTGVGKTIVSAILINIFRSKGLKTGAMKPFETGCRREGDILIPSDCMFLKDVAGMDEPINYITPVTLEKPLAPMVSAQLDGVEINLEAVRNAYNYLKRRYDVLVVEGVGGLLVPIKKDYLVVDLIKELGLPVILVSRPGLGTINHTLLSLSYLLKENIVIKGIIFNYSSPPEGTLAEETNTQVISELTEVPVIGVVPYLRSFDNNTFLSAGLKYLNLENLNSDGYNSI